MWYNIQSCATNTSSQEFHALRGGTSWSGVQSMNPNHTSPLQLVSAILKQGCPLDLPACDVGLLRNLSIHHNAITDAVLPRWNCRLYKPGDCWKEETSEYILTQGCMNPKELVNAKRVIDIDGKVCITLIAAPLNMQANTLSVFVCFNSRPLGWQQRCFEACSFCAPHFDLGDLCSYIANSIKDVHPTHVDVEYNINTGGMCQELDLYSICINQGEMRVTAGVAKHLAPCVRNRPSSSSGVVFMPMNQLHAMPVSLGDMLPAFDIPHITCVLRELAPATFDTTKANKMLRASYQLSLVVAKVLSEQAQPSARAGQVSREIAASCQNISLSVLARFVRSAQKATEDAMQNEPALAWVSGKLAELGSIIRQDDRPVCREAAAAVEAPLQIADRKVRLMEEMLRGCTWNNPAASHFHVPKSESMNMYVMRGLPTPVAHFKADQQGVKLFKVLVLYLQGDQDDARVHALEIMQSVIEAKRALHNVRGNTSACARRLQRSYDRLKEGLLAGMGADMHPASILRVVLDGHMPTL